MRCCPLTSGGDDNGPSCSQQVVRRARKPHTCCECRESIPIGAAYEHYSGIWDGSPSAYKTCLSCVEIRNHFTCKPGDESYDAYDNPGGFVFGNLWSDLRENFFDTMTAGGECMRGLSPAAMARMFERRLAWLEKQGPRRRHGALR
jgi:hypothetical protein